MIMYFCNLDPKRGPNWLYQGYILVILAIYFSHIHHCQDYCCCIHVKTSVQHLNYVFVQNTQERTCVPVPFYLFFSLVKGCGGKQHSTCVSCLSIIWYFNAVFSKWWHPTEESFKEMRWDWERHCGNQSRLKSRVRFMDHKLRGQKLNIWMCN